MVWLWLYGHLKSRDEAKPEWFSAGRWTQAEAEQEALEYLNGSTPSFVFTRARTTFEDKRPTD